MSLWVAAVMAKGYQQEAELDPFCAACSWHCKTFLSDKLCQCELMGYPAPRLPADESRFTPSRTLPVTLLILQRIGFGSGTGYVLRRLDPSMAISWLPTSLGYEDRELIDHCKYDATCKILPS